MKKTIALLLCLVLALSLFAGCKDGKNSKAENGDTQKTLTPAEILKTATEKMQALKSWNGDLTLDADIHLATNGTKMDLAVDANLIGGMHTDPLDFHYAGTVAIDAMGENEEIALELIGKTEDGKLALYTWTDDEDQFTRQELELDEAKLDTQKYLDAAQELDWSMETTDTSYVLSYTLTKEDSKKIYDEAMKLAQEQDEDFELPEDMADLSGMLEGMKIQLTVDKERMYLTEANVDLSAILTGDFPKLVFGMYMMMGGGDDVDIDLTGSTCIVNVKFRDYDAAAEIKAPENYVDADDWSDWEDWDDEDWDDQDWQTGNILDSLDDTMTVEGVTFHAKDITPRELMDQGWVVVAAMDHFSEEALDEDALLAPGEGAEVFMAPADWNGELDEVLDLELNNYGEEDVSYLDCAPTAVYVNFNSVYLADVDQVVDFTVAEGISYGSSIDEAIEKLGDPHYTIEMDNVNYYYWAAEDGTTFCLMPDDDGIVRSAEYLFMERLGSDD